MNRFIKGIWLIFRYGPAKVADWQTESIYDELTGLYNRRFLSIAGKRELAKVERAARTGTEYPVSVVFADIRKFKAVNDTEGHAAGDEVLCRVAVLLKKVFRQVDVVCRLNGGGDEFVVLLPGTTVDGALTVVRRLQIAAKELFSPGGKLIELNCGISNGKSSLRDLLEEADGNMYKAKKGLKP